MYDKPAKQKRTNIKLVLLSFLSETTSATGTSATQRDPLSGDGLGQLHEVSVRVAQVGAHDRPPRARAPNRPRLNRHTEIPEPRDSVRQRDVEEEAQVGAAWRGP